MNFIEMLTRRLFDLIQQATREGKTLSTIGGSHLLIQEDSSATNPNERFYAAVVVLMDYGSTPEQALDRLVTKVKRQVHGEQKTEGVLPEAGEEEPG